MPMDPSNLGYKRGFPLEAFYDWFYYNVNIEHLAFWLEILLDYLYYCT